MASPPPGSILSATAVTNVTGDEQMPAVYMNTAGNFRISPNSILDWLSSTKNNNGLAKSGDNSDITSLSALTTPIPINEGGTGVKTAVAALSALGAAASGANNDITSLSAISSTLRILTGFSSSVAVTLATNTAISFAVQATGFIVCFFCNSTTASPRGIWFCRPNSPVMTSIAQVTDANVATTTGVLTGTTGSAGNSTVSCFTDNNLYIENRSGSARAYTITIFGPA